MTTGSPGGAGRPPGETSGSEMRAHAEGIAERAKAEAQRLGQSARDQAETAAEARKDEAASRVQDVADAARASADELRGREDWLAEGIGGAATYLEDLAQGIRNKRVVDLLGDIEAFGRRNPAAFFGAAVALGFGAARVARSSHERRLREEFGEREALAATSPSRVAPPPYGAGSAGATSYARPESATARPGASQGTSTPAGTTSTSPAGAAAPASPSQATATPAGTSSVPPTSPAGRPTPGASQGAATPAGRPANETSGD